MRPQPLLHQSLIPLPIPRIPPHGIANLHQPAIKPLRIPPLKKPSNIALLLPTREPTQRSLDIPIQHHHIAPQLLINSLPVRLHVVPHLVPGHGVRRQRDGARVRVLDRDLGAELEVEEVVRERGGLDAAEGLQDDFFAVDGGRVLVFGFEEGVGGGAAVGDGDAVDGEAEGGVDCCRGGGRGGEVDLEAALGFDDGAVFGESIVS